MIARRLQGLTQSETAEMFRVHQTAISKMERGHFLPHPDMMAWALEVIRLNKQPRRGHDLFIRRLRAKLKQVDAAKRMGIKPYVLGEIEMGRAQIDDSSYERFCKCLIS
jgi:transcriptional regulator with XRE-family HTH domain